MKSKLFPFFLLTYLLPTTVFGIEDTLENALEDAMTHIQSSQYLEAYEILAPFETSASNDPRYNYLLGLTALKTGRHSLAVNAFERTLLLQPYNAGAHLDLAISLVKLKNYQKAQETLSKLKNNFVVPKEISKVIRNLENNIYQSLNRSTYKAYSVHLEAGHASNVNSGTDNQLIELDLGSGPVLLPISNNSLSQPDTFLATGVNGTYIKTLNNYRLKFISAIQRKDYTSLNEFDSLNVVFGASFGLSNKENSIESGLFFSNVWLNSNQYQKIASSITSYSYQLNKNSGIGTHIRVALEEYKQSPNNNVSQIEAGAHFNKALSFFDKAFLFQTTAKLSQAKAKNDRAGGNQNRFDLSARFSTNILDNATAKAEIYRIRSRDTEAYNQLLFGNTTRLTDKRGFKLAYERKIQKNSNITIQLDHNRQKSNIGLFESKSTNITLRYQYSF